MVVHYPLAAAAAPCLLEPLPPTPLLALRWLLLLWRRDGGVQVSTIGWAGIVAVVVTPLCLTRNDALLAYTSMAGNVGVALVVATVLARAVQNGNIQPLPNYTDFKASSFMQAFG